MVIGRLSWGTFLISLSMKTGKLSPSLWTTKSSTNSGTSYDTKIQISEGSGISLLQDVCYCVYPDGSILPGSGTPVNAIRRTSCEDILKMNKDPDTDMITTTQMMIRQRTTYGGRSSTFTYPIQSTVTMPTSGLPDIDST